MQTSLTNVVRFPYLLEDMALVLRRAMSEPPRLKSDHVTFLKKVEDELSDMLVELPPHLLELFPQSGKERLTEAVHFLINARLATKAGMSSKSMSLVISELGHKWLNSTIEQKLEVVFAALKASRARVGVSYIKSFEFAPCPVPLMVNRRDVDLSDDLINVYSHLKPEVVVGYNSFIDEQVADGNPLALIAERSGLNSISIGANHYLRRPEELAVIWRDYLRSFMFQRLFALGCISFGTDSGGQLAFMFHSAGSYLLGGAESLEFEEQGADKVLIVQPDFDVVFLRPSPAVESRLTPFAERIGSGLGVLFKITRQSIMHAASLEMEADEVLEILQLYSLQPVSANVESEIRCWFGQCCYIKGSEAYVVTCPDHSTLMRIVEVAGGQVTVVSDTVLVLPDVRQKVPFLKMLKGNGIFLN